MILSIYTALIQALRLGSQRFEGIFYEEGILAVPGEQLTIKIEKGIKDFDSGIKKIVTIKQMTPLKYN